VVTAVLLAYRCAGCGQAIGVQPDEYRCPRTGVQPPHVPIRRRTRPQPADPDYTRTRRALRRRRTRKKTLDDRRDPDTQP
jgi:hypothetical protein